MAIPPPFTDDILPRLMLISADNILDGSSENVTVMRQTGGKRRTVVEGEIGFAWGEEMWNLGRS
jgi:hypothetical protein